ncbi:MMPL family transporter [Spirillospora sp. NPDC050679]
MPDGRGVRARGAFAFVRRPPKPDGLLVDRLTATTSPTWSCGPPRTAGSTPAGRGVGRPAARYLCDYNLFILTRFREELARGLPVDEAVVRSMGTAGRTVVFSVCPVPFGAGGLRPGRVPVGAAALAGLGVDHAGGDRHDHRAARAAGGAGDLVNNLDPLARARRRGSTRPNRPATRTNIPPNPATHACAPAGDATPDTTQHTTKCDRSTSPPAAGGHVRPGRCRSARPPR